MHQIPNSNGIISNKHIKVIKSMKTFKIEAGNRTITYSFPENFSEISIDYLKDVTKEVEIADNYTLIGLVYTEKLSNIIMSFKQKKNNISSGVIPIFIKSGKTDSEFIKNAHITDKVIISNTQLSLGHHVRCKNNQLDIDKFLQYISDDAYAYKRSIDENIGKVCFLEFKLVPNCDIVGFYVADKSIRLKQRFISIESNTPSLFAEA